MPPTKGILEANEKDIKKRVEKLLQLATELKAEVDKTDSSQVLSMAMVRKAEEIESSPKKSVRGPKANNRRSPYRPTELASLTRRWRSVGNTR